jgi:hypothetical protein
MMYRGRRLPPEQQKEDPSAFHHPPANVPGGQRLTPLLTVQQNAVQPLEQLAPSPHTAA